MERISKFKIKHMYYADLREWLSNPNSKITNRERIIKHKLKDAAKSEVMRGIRNTNDKIKNKVTSNLIIHMSIHRSGCHAVSNFIYNLYDSPKIYLEERALQANVIGFSVPSKCSKGYLLLNNAHLVYMHPIERMINKNWDSDNVSTMFVNWDTYVGKFYNILYVISLRDFFNSLASRIQREDMLGCLKDDHLVDKVIKNKDLYNFYLLPVVNIWKNYAKEFLGITNYLSGGKKILINYNKWLDEENKVELAAEIGLKFNNYSLNEIPKAGGGSSFTGITKVLNKEDLLTRWSMCLPENSKTLFKLYRHIFKDKELVDLNERIFGHIDGTEVFYE